MEKLVILADLGRFMAYKVTTDPMGIESPKIKMIKCFDCPDGHMHISEKVSDSAGRFRRAGKTGNGTTAGYGERHNMATENRRRLIKMAAEQIKDLLAEQGNPRWHMAAAKSINNSLVASLDPRLRDRLDMNIKADLTGINKSDVLSRFFN